MHGSIGGCWGGDDHGGPDTTHLRGKPTGLSPTVLPSLAEPVAYLTSARNALRHVLTDHRPRELPAHVEPLRSHL
jgi:hypothetical protein